MIREADEIFEAAVPRLPTRDEEIAYMKWLQDDFRSDPWFTIRTKKYMAGPKRWPFKNLAKLKDEYRVNFWIHFTFGAVLSYPFALAVGRRMQSYAGGVPAVPYQRWVEDWPNVKPN